MMTDSDCTHGRSFWFTGSGLRLDVRIIRGSDGRNLYASSFQYNLVLEQDFGTDVKFLGGRVIRYELYECTNSLWTDLGRTTTATPRAISGWVKTSRIHVREYTGVFLVGCFSLWTY